MHYGQSLPSEFRGATDCQANFARGSKNGDRLDQKTFHERYEAMPENVRAELIGGEVFMASPQKSPHEGSSQPLVVRWLDEYAGSDARCYAIG